MRAEYNFDYSKAVRGKYYKRVMEGANVIASVTRRRAKRPATRSSKSR